MTIKLHNKWVLVAADVDTNSGGLFIPKTLSDSDTEGVVAFVPDGIIEDIKVGDTIKWERYAEAEGKIELNSKQYYPIKISQIIFSKREGK